MQTTCVNLLGRAVVRLTEEEEAILAGEQGTAARAALQSQIAVGDFFSAEQLVAIESAHVMADWDVMGVAGRAYLQRLADAGGAVAVPTTRNPGAVDFAYATRLRQSPGLIEGEQSVRKLLSELGVDLVDTCVGYQTMPTPEPGSHIAWGDTGAVIYANSVLGARTNFESGPAAIAAAITGRTPAYGFHLDDARAPNVRCRLAVQPRDCAEWGALGAAVGLQLHDYWAVPLIEGIETEPSADELKHLGASLASYGSLAMFHIPGVTPEASAAEARHTDLQIDIGTDELQGVFASDARAGEPVDLVVFTAPQLSLTELGRLAGLLNGRHIHPDVTLLATTSPMTRNAPEASGAVAAIEAAGGLVLNGTCWYLMAPKSMGDSFGWRHVVTNSAKLLNIAKASEYTVTLRTTEACIEAALTGSLDHR